MLHVTEGFNVTCQGGLARLKASACKTALHLLKSCTVASASTKAAKLWQYIRTHLHLLCTWVTPALHRVHTWFAHGLHMVYIWSARGLQAACTWLSWCSTTCISWWERGFLSNLPTVSLVKVARTRASE